MSAQLQDREFTDLDGYQFAGDHATVTNKRACIVALRENATIYHAAQVAGIHRATYFRWYERDPAFAAACDDALEDSADILETSVYKRALNGDGLLSMFWLKAHRHKFRDKVTLDIPAIQDEIRSRLASVPNGLDNSQFLPSPRQLQKSNEDSDTGNGTNDTGHT